MIVTPKGKTICFRLALVDGRWTVHDRAASASSLGFSRVMDSFVVSSMSRAPRIIGRGTAHAAMIFTELLRKEQYELQRAVPMEPDAHIKGGRPPGSLHDALEAARSSPDALIITVAQRPFEITHVNAAWESLCGYSAEEAVGKTSRILRGLDTSRESCDMLNAALNRKQGAAVRLLNYTKAGTPFINDLQVVPLSNDGGTTVTHFVGKLTPWRIPAELPEYPRAFQPPGESYATQSTRVRMPTTLRPLHCKSASHSIGMPAEGRPIDSFVVSSMSRAPSPRIIGRGTAHAAMIFTELLRKEQYELQRPTSASSSSRSTRSPRTPTVAWSTRMPIQLSDSDGSDVSSPSDSFTVSSEVQRAARSELARQTEYTKELQTALEASRKDMEQLQDRISKLETMAHAAPQDISSSSVVAPDRPLCEAPCHKRPVATATMATARTVMKSVRRPEVHVDDDVARMPPMLPRRMTISRDKVSEVLSNLQDLAKARPN
jgi:PAS domain S-box-containing protein